MVEASGTPDLVWVRPDDMGKLLAIAKEAYRIKELWDDESRANPTLWFAAHFGNPANLVFDVCQGAGVIAFLRTVPGYKAQAYIALWHQRAMRRHDLVKLAATIAFLAKDLVTIDTFVRPDNKLSQRLCLACGMHYKGTIKELVCYNGERVPMLWYEGTRPDVGLELT